MTGEFRHQTVTQTFLVTPDRGRVVAAKLVAYPLAGIALALVSVLAFTAAVATGWLAAKGITPSLLDARLGRVLLGAVLAAGLCGLVGVGVAALVRNQVAALVGVAVWVLLVEGLLMSLLNIPAAWASGCPRAAAAALTNPGGGQLSRLGRHACCWPATRWRWRWPAPAWSSAATSPNRQSSGRRPHASSGARTPASQGRSVMASLRTWRTVAAALLLVVLATTATTAAAGATTPAHQQAHYCKRVDAYRIKTCAKAILPASPLGRQLGWVLAQLAGEAATLTEAEVRAHFSAEFLTVWVDVPPEVVIQAFQQNLAERGTFTFVGFAYPPRARRGAGPRPEHRPASEAAVPIGVTSGRPALIEFLDAASGPTHDRAQGPPLGLVRHRRAAAVPALHRPPQPHGGVRGRADHRLVAAAEPAGGVHAGVQLRPPNGPGSRSDPAPTPRTARDFVADLHALLADRPRARALCAGRPLQQRPVHPAVCQHPPPPGGRAGPDRRRASRLPQAEPGDAQAAAAARGVGGPAPAGDDRAASAGGPRRGRHLDQ